MVKLTIDGQEVEVPDGTTVLEAAKELNIKIPTLCYNRHLKPYGGCRMCLVEKSIPNSPRPPELIVSCAYPAENSAVISTNSERVLKARRFVIELILVKCPDSNEIKDIAISNPTYAINFSKLTFFSPLSANFWLHQIRMASNHDFVRKQ